MKVHQPEGFEHRDPVAKKIQRKPLTAAGPNHEWSGDGHEKLAALGFPVWGIRDKWSGKWLGLWCVPSARHKVVVAYLFLSLVHELGGTLPILPDTQILNPHRYSNPNDDRLWVRDWTNIWLCMCPQVTFSFRNNMGVCTDELLGRYSLQTFPWMKYLPTAF